MTNTQRNPKKPTAWGLIIALIIIFWPIGIFLLFRRLLTDKTAILKNSKIVSILSYVLIGMGVLYAIGSLGNASDMVGAFVIWVGGGIWLNIIARRMKATGKRYKEYIELIVNQSRRSIDYIATVVGVSYDVVVKDLRKMIEVGYFTGAYIDEGIREIVLAQTSKPQMPQADAQTQSKKVTCSSCGAHGTVIIGQVGQCEYCDSPLS